MMLVIRLHRHDSDRASIMRWWYCCMLLAQQPAYVAAGRHRTSISARCL